MVLCFGGWWRRRGYRGGWSGLRSPRGCRCLVRRSRLPRGRGLGRGGVSWVAGGGRFRVERRGEPVCSPPDGTASGRADLYGTGLWHYARRRERWKQNLPFDPSSWATGRVGNLGARCAMAEG